ncbi:MAG: hypothetical protein V4614_08980 [Pseudomonadota bacterium]
MKTIIFSKVSIDRGLGNTCIDLSSHRALGKSRQETSISSVLLAALEQSGGQWFQQFSTWMGELNRDNGDLHWWAHSSTAKNMLSSQLGERYIQVCAVCQIARQTETSTLSVVGASQGQMEAIKSLLGTKNFHFSGTAWKWRQLTRFIGALSALARQFLQAARVVMAFRPYRSLHIPHAPDLCLFTYVDGIVRGSIDSYFGTLPHLLYGDKKATSAIYLAYVYQPFSRRTRELSNSQKNPDTPSYAVLFRMLRVSDFLWALGAALREWRINPKFKVKNNQHADYIWLLREAFMDDLAVGGYQHHLLVYRAIIRFVNAFRPQTLVYPFENKSIEKMIVLGVTRTIERPRLVGYQHTSITPRHASFLFEPGEAERTPLPEKIVTTGKITKSYLEEIGNYPIGIFIEGFSLRQQWGEPLPRRPPPVKRMLLALSSSRAELIQSIEFCRRVVQGMPELELGIRPHINFPLSVLPPKLLDWVKQNAHDFSETSLQENLEWCTVTAYVSSTVALETMMRGKPVINFSIGDVVPPDPVIGAIPFHWNVRTDSEMIATLMQLHELDEATYTTASAAAVAYVRDYLSPLDHASLDRFSQALLS